MYPAQGECLRELLATSSTKISIFQTNRKWAASAVALGADGKPMLVTFGGSGIDRSMVPITCLDLRKYFSFAKKKKNNF